VLALFLILSAVFLISGAKNANACRYYESFEGHRDVFDLLLFPTYVVPADGWQIPAGKQRESWETSGRIQPALCELRESSPLRVNVFDSTRHCMRKFAQDGVLHRMAKIDNKFSAWGKCFPTSQSFSSLESSVYHPDLSRSHRSSFNLWVYSSSNYQCVGLRAIANIAATFDSNVFENNLGRLPRKSCFYWSL